MKTILSLAFSALLTACVQVGPKDIPINDCPKLRVPECPQCPTCPKLTVPQCPSDDVVAIKEDKKECPTVNIPPIDQTVTIKIRGNTVEADEGGAKLLRYYVYAQKLLRSH